MAAGDRRYAGPAALPAAPVLIVLPVASPWPVAVRQGLVDRGDDRRGEIEGAVVLRRLLHAVGNSAARCSLLGLDMARHFATTPQLRQFQPNRLLEKTLENPHLRLLGCVKFPG